MSQRHFARPTARLVPAGKSRFAVRREELLKQEQLLLEKKKQVEAKLLCSSCSGEQSNSSSTAEPAPAGLSPALIPGSLGSSTKAQSSAGRDGGALPTPAVANKFQNNGSFLEMFRAMQQKPVKDEDRGDQQSPANANDTAMPADEKSAVLEAIEKCATFVAMNGQSTEQQLRERFQSAENYQWLFDEDSVDYKYFKHRVCELESAGQQADGDEDVEKETDCGYNASSETPIKKRKKSRWGSESEVLPLDADLMQYAMQVFGSVALEENQWRQLKDQRKMRMLTVLTRKKLRQQTADVQPQFEYDSDEDVDGGTWEHKRRMQEMEKTKEKAHLVTEASQGKHHIGDFLPPDELSRFLQQWERIKDGKPSESMDNNYEKFKIASDNVGFKMMQQMGWKEGESLGSSSVSGITEPIACQSTSEHRGLGAEKVDELKEGDDEFEAYRKRMMFAYRFRPNPLNNPRRTYY